MNRLLDFFLREIDAEEAEGFPRLSRVPDSHVATQLAYYQSLGEEDRRAFRDCCAHWACWHYGFAVDAPRTGQFQHPFFERWNPVRRGDLSAVGRSVPLLRATVQQYKIDAQRGVASSVSEEEFGVASTVRSVKALELRKRVRAALKPLGTTRSTSWVTTGAAATPVSSWCTSTMGGRSTQLRYCVAMPEFPDVHPLSQFCFERALGFGLGDWDYIVEENVGDVMALFTDVVGYCATLPDRIWAEAG